jgi:hypothetical protein
MGGFSRYLVSCIRRSAWLRRQRGAHLRGEQTLVAELQRAAAVSVEAVVVVGCLSDLGESLDPATLGWGFARPLHQYVLMVVGTSRILVDIVLCIRTFFHRQPIVRSYNCLLVCLFMF